MTDWPWRTADYLLNTHGFYIFPLRARDKTPLPGFRWRDESSNDPDQLLDWREQYPDANVACDLAKSGLLVVDVDTKVKSGDGYEFSRAGYDNLLEHLARHQHWDFDGQMTAGTGSGGWHWWLRQPDPPLRGRTGMGGTPPLGQHIDVKGVGGYALIPGCTVPPPFKHELADGFYRPEYTASLDPQPATAWLVELLRASERPAREPDYFDTVLVGTGVDYTLLGAPGNGSARLAGLARAVAAAPVGNQNNILNWASYEARDALAEGAFTVQEFVSAMKDACHANGLARDGYRWCVATIASGLGISPGVVGGAW